MIVAYGSPHGILRNDKPIKLRNKTETIRREPMTLCTAGAPFAGFMLTNELSRETDRFIYAS